jgi:hypothetical protein
MSVTVSFGCQSASALTQGRDTRKVDTVITVDPGAQGCETTKDPSVWIRGFEHGGSGSDDPGNNLAMIGMMGLRDGRVI